MLLQVCAYSSVTPASGNAASPGRTHISERVPQPPHSDRAGRCCAHTNARACSFAASCSPCGESAPCSATAIVTAHRPAGSPVVHCRAAESAATHLLQPACHIGQAATSSHMWSPTPCTRGEIGIHALAPCCWLSQRWHALCAEGTARFSTLHCSHKHCNGCIPAGHAP